MSEYSIDHLAEHVRIGYGYRPWWGDEATRRGISETTWSRPGAIPMTEVYEVLGDKLELQPMYEPDLTTSEFQRVVNPRTGTRIGAPVGKGYRIHQPAAWLADHAAPLVEAMSAEGLGVATVMTLGDGAKSALTLSLPDSLKSATGMEVRPWTALKTSHDQSLATATHNGHTLVVCDNTARLSENGTLVGFKVKHTRNSGDRKQEYGEAIRSFFGYATQVLADIDALASVEVSDAAFERIIAKWVGDPGDTKQGQTKAQNATDRLVSLWRHDLRVAPWRGTALGVVQATNTYQTHYATVRGMHRAERQMEALVKGVDIDAEIRKILTDAALVAV